MAVALVPFASTRVVFVVQVPDVNFSFLFHHAREAVAVLARLVTSCQALTPDLLLPSLRSKKINVMYSRLVSAVVLPFLFADNGATAQSLTPDVPYVENGHKRHVLDIYTPKAPAGKSLPVMLWIHGGGWQAGDKSDVALKPSALTERGFVFVSTNYRLLPEVGIEELIGDVASSVGWVHRNIAKYGGDPTRIFVGGHSAGAQVAALICIDDRYLEREGVRFDVLRGCVPVDGDSYDIPKIVMTTEQRQALYGGKMPTFGHRQKFGNHPEKHVDLSAVTHIARNKRIPPFLILYFSGNPDTQAQAQRLESALRASDIRARSYGKSDSNHSRLNDDLGKPDDPATQEFYKFLDPLVEPGAR